MSLLQPLTIAWNHDYISLDIFILQIAAFKGKQDVLNKQLKRHKEKLAAYGNADEEYMNKLIEQRVWEYFKMLLYLFWQLNCIDCANLRDHNAAHLQAASASKCPMFEIVVCLIYNIT